VNVALAVIVAIALPVGTVLVAGLTTLRRAASVPVAVGADAAATTVSVIVPARNEAATLPRLLASLLALDPGPLEVIVVDDSSDDDTAAVARRHGATVVAAQPPVGWLGKPWACTVGADRARGTHLLFLDADTELAGDALGALRALGAPDRLVSVQPHHRTIRAYEQLSAYCNVVSMMGCGAFAWPRPLGPAVAFGPCLFTSVEAYEAAGGHTAVRGEVVEDVALARNYAAAGFAVSVVGGGDLVRFRMYPEGARQLVEGWSKNLAAGAGAASRLAVAGAVLYVVTAAAVSGALAVDGWRWLALGAGAPVVPLVCYGAVAAHLAWVLGRIGSFRWWTSAVFPLPLVAFLAIFANSLAALTVRREVSWRGRRISVGPGPERP
jgi:4,4'-diaponeurosporenoate glycosyltransferase